MYLLSFIIILIERADLERRLQAAEQRATAAEQKLSDVLSQLQEVQNRADEAERKAQVAEERAVHAEQSAEEAKKKAQLAENTAVELERRLFEAENDLEELGFNDILCGTPNISDSQQALCGSSEVFQRSCNSLDGFFISSDPQRVQTIGDEQSHCSDKLSITSL